MPNTFPLAFSPLLGCLPTLTTSDMSMSVSDILTPIEVGTLISSILYGVMCTQAYSYYILRRLKDHFAVKMLLAVVLTLETVHLVFTFVHLHRVTIQSFNDPRSLDRVSWSFAVNFSVMSVNDSLVQAFYAYRIRKLSSRWWPLIPVALLIPARTVVGIYVTSQMLQIGSMRLFGASDKYLCILNLALKLSIDLYITVSLCWLLSRLRFEGTRQTRDMVVKLVVWTAEVGLLNSICAFVILVMILSMENMIWTSLVVIYPRLISNSLFAMLNGRPNGAANSNVQLSGGQWNDTRPVVSTMSYASGPHTMDSDPMARDYESRTDDEQMRYKREETNSSAS
ncbi:hypothetical protein BDV98DRAFT_577566 [Pterulicium gracile]|uniref:DUF6534 domain-containing protein n=1 Tax=Pterulicium gracile TaxID=1884261 RepID=A0A5C3Q1U7_9AGAR|nr:hypothetical protein BDV98DRAFT_577566 [Pterula gracilis]